MATQKLNLTVGPPSFGGHHESVVVGGKRWGLPPATDVKTIRSSDGRELAYALGYDDFVHVLIREGEVPIPPQLIDSIKARYFPRRAAQTREAETR